MDSHIYSARPGSIDGISPVYIPYLDFRRQCHRIRVAVYRLTAMLLFIIVASAIGVLEAIFAGQENMDRKSDISRCHERRQDSVIQQRQLLTARPQCDEANENGGQKTSKEGTIGNIRRERMRAEDVSKCRKRDEFETSTHKIHIPAMSIIRR